MGLQNQLDYSNNKMIFDLLQHFDMPNKKSQIGAWILLILNGYRSHMIFEFYWYFQKHNIELFRLPPHCTHLIQPLDVECFQFYKYYYTEIIDGVVRTGN